MQVEMLPRVNSLVMGPLFLGKSLKSSAEPVLILYATVVHSRTYCSGGECSRVEQLLWEWGGDFDVLHCRVVVHVQQMLRLSHVVVRPVEQNIGAYRSIPE